MLLSARRDDSRDELQGHFQFEKIQYKISWVNLKQSSLLPVTQLSRLYTVHCIKMIYCKTLYCSKYFNSF